MQRAGAACRAIRAQMFCNRHATDVGQRHMVPAPRQPRMPHLWRRHLHQRLHRGQLLRGGRTPLELPLLLLLLPRRGGCCRAGGVEREVPVFQWVQRLQGREQVGPMPGSQPGPQPGPLRRQRGSLFRALHPLSRGAQAESPPARARHGRRSVPPASPPAGRQQRLT